MFFVIMHKENVQYLSKGEITLPENRQQNIMIAELIELKIPASRQKYGNQLRRVVVWNDKNKQTNYRAHYQSNVMATNTISELYKTR